MFYIFLSVTLIVFLLFAQEIFKFRSFVWISFIVYFLFQLCVVDWLLASNLILGIVVILLNTIWFDITIIISYYLRKKSGVFVGYYFFLLLWLINEYSHLYGVLHWPWLNLGNFFSSTPNIIQWYEYTGIAGGSLWILTFSCFLHYLLKNNKLIVLFYVVLVISIPLLISQSLEKPNINNYTEAKITFGQNLFNNNEKIRKSELERIELSILEIAKKDSSIFFKENQIDHCIIFPEGYIHTPSSTNFFASYFAKSKILNKVGPHVSLYFGGILLEKTKAGIEYYNVVWFYSNQKIKTYKKTKLVPVFEKKVLMQEQLQSFFQNEFQKGLVTANFKKQQPITTENGEYLLIVCYEVAFGSFIASKIDFNRSVAFVLSNDEWIKSLKGKLQHFNFSKLRAIETRKMFVNVTNEGFSGLIDATGNVISIDDGTKASCSFGSIKLLETRTFYAKHGDWLYAASLVLFLVSIVIKIQIKLVTKIIFFFLIK